MSLVLYMNRVVVLFLIDYDTLLFCIKRIDMGIDIGNAVPVFIWNGINTKFSSIAYISSYLIFTSLMLLMT